MTSVFVDVKGRIWNQNENRLRMPFRLVGAVLVFVIVGQLVGGVFGLISDQYQGGLFVVFGETNFREAIRAGVSLFGALTAIFTAGVTAFVVDRRRFRDFGFRFRRAWWYQLGFGLFLGAALMTLVFVTELALGWIQITGFLTASPGFAPSVLLLTTLLVFVGTSLTEELLVRGILLTNLAEGLAGLGPLSERGGTAVAVVLTSVLFGALHLNNPNATVISSASVAFGGVFLALGYVLTGDLAVPLGVHLTWNYVQGVVYGFPVSGVIPGVQVVATRQTGPTVLTGGAFGPEAGLLGVAAVFLGIGVVVLWVRRTDSFAEDEARIWVPELR
ncbi:CPBP family intramembrane glutamic endopeptidase [Haloglomus litoreum]|uniref:CPBP family intramembrane glutamic endopeptidase n=1 Tax=Haloglomus litoreum TaxID=3034026 RepID=UPI0023E8561B|nr:CPBP family intramembrane glutamic endopeptidase [Haloglomus sp. DT116]